LELDDALLLPPIDVPAVNLTFEAAEDDSSPVGGRPEQRNTGDGPQGEGVRLLRAGRVPDLQGPIGADRGELPGSRVERDLDDRRVRGPEVSAQGKRDLPALRVQDQDRPVRGARGHPASVRAEGDAGDGPGLAVERAQLLAPGDVEEDHR